MLKKKLQQKSNKKIEIEPEAEFIVATDHGVESNQSKNVKFKYKKLNVINKNKNRIYS